MRKPTPKDLTDEEALRQWARGDKATYERHVAEHPEFRSLLGQALPDVVYKEALQRFPVQRIADDGAGRPTWLREDRNADARTAWLQAHMQRHRHAVLAAEAKVKNFSRIEAVAHTALKCVVPSAFALTVLFYVTSPMNVAFVTPLAIVYCGIKIVGAALTSEVL